MRRHLGLHKQAYLPQNRGFDYSFGYYSGAMDYYAHNAQGPYLDLHRAHSHEEQQCQPMYNGTYDLGVLIAEANSVLDQHSPEDNNSGKGNQPHVDTPLFMYLALHSVHEVCNIANLIFTASNIDTPLFMYLALHSQMRSARNGCDLMLQYPMGRLHRGEQCVEWSQH